MNRVIPFLFLLGISFAIIGCTPKTKTFSGKVIQIDYSNINTIKDRSWIKIDSWKFTHFRSMKMSKQKEYSLPTTTIVVDSTEERTLKTSITSRSIGLYIERNLDDINQNKLDNNSPKYRIINPTLIPTRGIIQIAKTDSSQISVEVSRKYPAKIKVLKR